MNPSWGFRPRTIVICVGNAFRRDDAAGLEVAQRLRARLGSSVNVVEHDGETSGLIDRWEGADLAVVVDSVHTQWKPTGYIHRVEIDGAQVASPARPVSSHGIGAGDAVALGRAMGRLPARLVLYGIEGATFTTGVGLSPEVDRSVDEVVRRLVEEVSDDVPQHPRTRR